MPSVDPVAKGRLFTQALLVAVQPGRDHRNYYGHSSTGDDGGYLRALTDTCQQVVSSLPAYSAVSDALIRTTDRIVAYQSLNHGDARGTHEAFTQWAVAETKRYGHRVGRPDLRWWEVGAAGDSSLATFALIAAATDPHIGAGEVAVIENAYFPWIGAVNTLLDSLVDQDEDGEPRQHRLLDYYASPKQAAARIALITRHALRQTECLPQGHVHALILAAMTNFYLTSPEARAAVLGDVRDHLRDAVGPLDTPTLLVMHARRMTGRADTLGRAT